MFIEGYSGLLLIDKLYFNHKTYLLKIPVKYYPFKIYGVYDERGSFKNFVSEPEIGFHYLGLSDKGHSICTGDIQYLNPESLGLLPESYSNLKNIFSNKDEDAKHKFEKLLGQNLIEEII
jgi:hypothetical protein